MDLKLQEVAQKLRSGQAIQPSSPSIGTESANRALRQQCRLLNSSIAQMVSAAHSPIERKQVGTAALEMVQALGDFTDTVEDVVATRQGQDIAQMERYYNFY